MRKLIVSLCIISFTLRLNAQNIYSAIHLNEEREIRKGIPKQIIKHTTFYNSNGSIETKNEQTEYDKFGLPLKTTILDDNKIISITDFVYDTLNRVILESNRKEINARFPSRRIKNLYYYEKNQKSPIKIVQLDKNGIILTEIILKNNSIGLPIELNLFEPLGYLVGSEIATYDTLNNRAFVSVVNNQGKIISTDTMKISFKEAYKYSDSDVQYNVNKDVIFYKNKWRDGDMHYKEYEYSYDVMDNWKEYKEYEIIYNSKGNKKRKLKAVFKREIFYWDLSSN